MTLGPRGWVLAAVPFALPLVVFLLLMASPGQDSRFGTNSFHFYVVSATALAAAIACCLVVMLTESLRETRLVFLGLAFLSIAAIFAVHGLGTPGHIHSTVHAELRVSSWFSVLAGAVFIAASVVSLPPAAEDWLKRWGAWLFGSVALLLGIYIGLSFATPDWMAWLPTQERWLQLTVTAITLSLLGFSAWRYLQAFMFARLISQLAMVGALVLLMEVQVSMTWGRYWQTSWWLYHGCYAAAFVVLFAGWFVEARRAGSVRVLAEALSMRDAIAQLGHGHSQPVADLIDAIEWKDLYTLGHVRRVATYAVMIGKEMSLSTLDLRSLALGAQMHDVGKIGVPDRILTKPGRLTPEEYDLIREHATRGYEIASRVATLRSVTDTIRYHHERMDGLGYPDGLAGDAIPLHARIVSVADSFDAMTSGRVYQPAISKEDAIAELRQSAGSQFDSRCVEAFVLALSRLRDSEGLPDVVAGRVTAANAA